MLAIKTNDNQSQLILKKLEKLGILVYLYKNESEEGISIFPQFNIKLEVLKKALKIIIKHVSNF